MEEVRIDANDLVFRANPEQIKTVRKCTPTSGAIYLHKRFIGKRFRVILIPLDDDDVPLDEEKVPTVSGETKKAQDGLAKLKKDVGGLKKKK